MDRRAWQAKVHGVANSQTRQSDSHFPTFSASHIPPGLGCFPLDGTGTEAPAFLAAGLITWPRLSQSETPN